LYYFQGRILGITVGCLLGMLPLLFLDDIKKNKAETAEKDANKTV
jgi:hypothetical protein